MRKSNQLACGLLIVGILLPIAQSTKADSLTITSGQTVQLGLPGIVTNYSYSSVTVDAGGTLKISGSVTMIVTSNVLINGSITGGTDASGSAGMAGGAGGDGVVTGDVSGDGDDGGYGTNGSDGVADVPYLSILARNMIVNGSILFNPQGNGGNGGDGGDAGNGADGLSPIPGSIAGGAAGWGGPGGPGGNGGNSPGAPYLSIDVVAEGGTLPSAGKFILATNAVISLNNMGTGGGGGKGGAGGVGGIGGNGATGGPGGSGGEGGPSGVGGMGGYGGTGGTLAVHGMGIDLEGMISLRGNDGGDGGELGVPKNGGNGGNGAADPQGGAGGRGGNAGDAGDAFLLENPGSGGGNGGFGGNFYVTVSSAFTNFATTDFSGGNGGNGGAGQPGGVAMPGTPGAGAGGSISGQAGQPSADIPDGPVGIAGANGSMSVINPAWGTNVPNGWQPSGHGIVIFSVTDKTNTAILSSSGGAFAIAGQTGDPRYQYDSGAGQSIVETNEPVQLQFAYQWLSTSGSVDVLLGGRVVAQLNAPPVLNSGFTEQSLVLTGLPAEASDSLTLTFQLNSTGPAEFQLGSFSLVALPQLPFLSVSPSSTNTTALTLSWFGATNENYQVQYRASLGGGTWTNLDSAIPGQDASSSFPLSVTPGDPAGFYRLLMTPSN